MDLERPFDMIACPRNWAKLSTLLTNMEARTKNGFIEDMNDLEFAADGCVGCKCGPSFSAFYQYKKMLIEPEDIVNGNVAPEDMSELTEEVLYLTAQSLVDYMTDDMAANAADNDTGVSDECFGRIANVFNWIIDVGENVRLDTAVSMIQDLSASFEGKLRTIVLSDAFDEACPRFADFASMNYIVL